MRKNALLCILWILVSAIVLAGCSGGSTPPASADSGAPESATSTPPAESSGEKTVLRFAGFCAEDGTVGNMYFPLLEEFLAANPDIEIVNDYAFDDDLKAKVKAEAAGGSLPDIMAYWATLANSSWLYSSDMLVPTEELTASIDGLDISMIDESIIRTTSYDGVAYGIPLNTLRMCYIVNKALYEQCGVTLPTEYDKYTYEQFREDGKVFLENGIIPLAVGYKDGNPGHYYLAELISQMQGGLDELYGIMEYKNPAGSGNLARAIGIIQEDIGLGLYPKSFLNNSWNEQHALYSDRQAAAMYTITSSAAPLMVEDEQLLADSIVVPFPEIEGCVSSPSTRVARSVNWAIHVSANSWEDPVKQEAIGRFMSWFFSEEWQKPYATTEEPAVNFAYDLTESFGPFYQRVLETQEGWSYSPYYLSAVPDSAIFTSFKNAIMEAATLGITPQEFEDKCIEIFNELGELE